MGEDQWCAGPAECLTCGYEWGAAWPLGAAELVCPACGSRDTVREPADAEPETAP